MKLYSELAADMVALPGVCVCTCLCDCVCVPHELRGFMVWERFAGALLSIHAIAYSELVAYCTSE